VAALRKAKAEPYDTSGAMKSAERQTLVISTDEAGAAL
jgi:hypothetical protein